MADKVEVGQVYRDKDKRMSGRFLKVKTLDIRYAECVDCTSTGRELSTRKRIVSIVSLQTRFQRIQAGSE